MTFAGRVGLITGAGSGIGRATARLFAERGGAVLAADVSRRRPRRRRPWFARKAAGPTRAGAT